jgi:amidase
VNLEEYAQFDALALADIVRKGKVTAKELAAVALQGIEKVNPRLHAIIEVYADALPAIKKGPPPSGPFGGVPFLRKDIGATEAGRLQEMGSRLAKGRKASSDSFLMRRFKRAGFTILGRSATPEFALSSTTTSLLEGETRNPWRLERMAGGSSGGAAAAVASGMVPMAHASDGAGSIRIPASCCGLVGLKPSRGRVSAGPDVDEPLFGMAVEFVLCHTVRDCAAALDMAAGPEPGDPFVIPQPTGPFLKEVGADPGKLRIGFSAESWEPFPVDEEVRREAAKVAKACEAMGHHIVPKKPHYDFEGYARALADTWGIGTMLDVDDAAQATGRKVSLETLEQGTLALYEHGKRVTVERLMTSLGILNTIRREFGAMMEDIDLLLTPTLAMVPQPLRKYSQDQPFPDGTSFMSAMEDIGQYMAVFNITGLPAISLPLGQSADSLPIGMQFVAHFGDEARLFRIAKAFEEAMPWRDRKPLIHIGRD